MSYISEAISVAYERFLMRDITYQFAGIIIIQSIDYSLYSLNDN